MKKSNWIILLLCLTMPLVCYAQPKQKAEKEFVNLLNSVWKNSPEHHWSYDGSVSLDSAFAISAQGILSITFRYTPDSAVTKIMSMKVPVNSIREVGYDHYFVLLTDDYVVRVYEAESDQRVLDEKEKDNILHIGTPREGEDGYKLVSRLQKSLDKLRKYYP